MNTALKISVVTPSFNQGEFLEETIESVLGQHYPNLEYIIIDGGSEDDSRAIIEKYADQLHHWVSEPDSGHGNALNKGFAKATGEVMAWLNSDDKYLPWTFSVVSDIFQRFPDILWICGFHSYWSERGFLAWGNRVPRNIYDLLIGSPAFVQQESVFWRRSLWEQAGAHISEDYEFMVDHELWSRFYRFAPMINVDCILGGYRLHRGNRALLHKEAVQREARAVAKDLARNADQEVLGRARILSAIRKVQSAPGIRHLPVEKVFRALLRRTYGPARYPYLVHEQGAWRRTSRPYSVIPPA